MKKSKIRIKKTIFGDELVEVHYTKEVGENSIGNFRIEVPRDEYLRKFDNTQGVVDHIEQLELVYAAGFDGINGSASIKYGENLKFGK